MFLIQTLKKYSSPVFHYSCLLHIFQNKYYSMSSLKSLNFDNLALRTLPIDKETSNQTRTVVGACFSLIKPTPVENPVVVAYSPEALALLGIKEKDLEADDFKDYFSGNQLLNGSQSAAHCYCGHQFGYFSGQLGDGAAMYLGEIVNDAGQRWELQLKGAGLTPYSRNADGRKVLRSSIREFLCSEAMFYLGVPTTRAGSCITSDTRVVRDIFYDGNPIMERCTIVSRIAPSFIRFGSFEIFKPLDRETGRIGPSVGKDDILHTLLEYVVSTFYSEIWQRHSGNKENAYLDFFKEIVRRTAFMVAKWQCVGFCHGVLNTDNMSIIGVTIDYGPFGFMDYFNSDFICNASDTNGRYSYKKQPEICKWNLLKLAEAIKNAVPLDKTKEIINEIYDSEFKESYYKGMREKLGLKTINVNDEKLIQNLLYTMQQSASDFTNTFLILSGVSLLKQNDSEIVKEIVAQCQDAESFKANHITTANISHVKMIIDMAHRNPNILSRVGLEMSELQAIVQQYEEQDVIKNLTHEEKIINDRNLWKDWLKSYRERIMSESEGSVSLEEYEENRKQLMLSVNPRFILRNHLAQEAIEDAERGDYTKVRELLQLLRKPYLKDLYESQIAMTKYDNAAPASACRLRVT
ncbi:protein adenylyltransferase SelO, mitochondrial isoform X2 [Hydra vulgaris]|uniref:Selenoprotein O n=1 Tax=Hydra vulgaris TaxID=6087 RepID=A0ABM4CYB4_HYDVU